MTDPLQPSFTWPDDYEERTYLPWPAMAQEARELRLLGRPDLAERYALVEEPLRVLDALRQEIEAFIELAIFAHLSADELEALDRIEEYERPRYRGNLPVLEVGLPSEARQASASERARPQVPDADLCGLETATDRARACHDQIRAL